MSNILQMELFFFFFTFCTWLFLFFLMWTTWHFFFHIYVPYSHFVKRTRTGINHGVTSRTTGPALHLFDTGNKTTTHRLCFSHWFKDKLSWPKCTATGTSSSRHDLFQNPLLLCFTGNKMSRAKEMNVVYLQRWPRPSRRNDVKHHICISI